MIQPFDYTPEHFNPLEDTDRPEEIEPVDMDDDYDGWDDETENDNNNNQN